LQFHTGTRQETMRGVKKRARSADIDDRDGVARTHASGIESMGLQSHLSGRRATVEDDRAHAGFH
jgi:hypothetical protein